MSQFTKGDVVQQLGRLNRQAQRLIEMMSKVYADQDVDDDIAEGVAALSRRLLRLELVSILKLNYLDQVASERTTLREAAAEIKALLDRYTNFDHN